jgi:hypothetical protein
MAMENVAQDHTTVDEEEAAVETNWQFGPSATEPDDVSNNK